MADAAASSPRPPVVELVTEPWDPRPAFPHAKAFPDGRPTLTRIRAVSTGSASVAPITSSKGKPMTILFLHGAGDGDGVSVWLPLWKSLLADLPPNTEVLIPSGPLLHFDLLPKTSSSASRQHQEKDPKPAWLRISLPRDSSGRISEPINASTLIFDGIDEVSQALVQLVLDESSRGVLGRDIIIGGFSQGGAVAMWTGLAVKEARSNVRGLFALSGYIPQPQKLPAALDSLSRPPVLFIHGDKDQVIPIAWSEAAQEMLRRRELRPTSSSSSSDVSSSRTRHVTVHGLTHRVNREALSCLRAWIAEIGSLPRDQGPSSSTLEGHDARGVEKRSALSPPVRSAL